MFDDVLVLGGAGLVGLQVCRRLTLEMSPRRIVVASLLEREARAAVAALEAEFGAGVAYVPAWGNLFVPADLADVPRAELLSDPAKRQRLLDFLYGDFEAAYETNHLVQLIRTHRPQVIGKPTGHALICLMAILATNHRPDHHRFVHSLGQLGKYLADLNPRHVGRDRTKLAANLTGCFGLDFPHVLMGWTTTKKDIDQPFMGAFSTVCLGTQKVRQTKTTSSKRKPANRKKLSAR
jgi:hypothetical protein